MGPDPCSCHEFSARSSDSLQRMASTGQMNLSQFQKGVLWRARVACVIDMVVFTWLNMKLKRLSSDFVQMR